MAELPAFLDRVGRAGSPAMVARAKCLCRGLLGQLVAHVERCYWALCDAVAASRPRRSAETRRVLLLAAVQALCAAQELVGGDPQDVASLLGACAGLLAERGALGGGGTNPTDRESSGVGSPEPGHGSGFVKYCLARLTAELRRLRRPGDAGSKPGQDPALSTGEALAMGDVEDAAMDLDPGNMPAAQPAASVNSAEGLHDAGDAANPNLDPAGSPTSNAEAAKAACDAGDAAHPNPSPAGNPAADVEAAEAALAAAGDVVGSDPSPGRNALADAEEVEAARDVVDGALAQCLFALYGIDLPHRDADWGDGYLVRSHCEMSHREFANFLPSFLDLYLAQHAQQPCTLCAALREGVLLRIAGG